MEDIDVAWESVVYPDGGKYEGLMKEGQCHGRGIFLYPDGDRCAHRMRECREWRCWQMPPWMRGPQIRGRV